MSTYDQLMFVYKGLREDYIRTKALIDTHKKQHEELLEQVLDLKHRTDILDKTCSVLRGLIDHEMVANITTAETLLTEGLQHIFDDLNLSVRADTSIQRGKVSVDFVTVQEHTTGMITEGSSMDVYGGSVSTVQSTLLRIVVLTRRSLRPLLLLDESLSAVAERYVPRVGNFLRTLSEKLNLDILVVTHNPTLVEQADVAYRIKKIKGSATFTKIGRSQ